LANGQSSSEKVLENVQKVQSRNIRFSFNTVLDAEKTKDLTGLANFVSSFKYVEWGLNASYTENDQGKVNEVIGIFDDCIRSRRMMPECSDCPVLESKIARREGRCAG